MFIGEYSHSLDAKGRVSVPVKFRMGLGSSAIVTKGLDRCLFLYPKGEWEKTITKLSELPVTNAGARSFARMMTSGAMELEIDKQGRVLLPSYLREYAAIDGDVVITGANNRVEIWDKQSWQNYIKEADENASEVAEKLSEWGL